MKTQRKDRDIDSEPSLLRTANNLYKNSLEMMQAVQSNPQAYNIFKPGVLYKVIGYNLLESLLFGKAESAAGIAVLYQNGLGVEQDEYKSKLFIVIGSKLGDTACQGLMAGKDYSAVENEVDVWVKIIKEMGGRYPDKDAEITAAMVLEAREQLNAELPGRLIPAPSAAELTTTNDNEDQPSTSGASANQEVVSKQVSVLTTIGVTTIEKKQHTAKQYQDQGQRYLEDVAQEMHDTNLSHEEVDNRLERVHKSFWFALALGSEKAPFCLFQCLMKAVGGQKDEGMATLMYGVALKLTPKDCSQIAPNDRPVIAKSMHPKITELVKFIKETKAHMPKDGVDNARFNSLLIKCNDVIEGITGKKIPDCFSQHSAAIALDSEQTSPSSGSELSISHVIPDRRVEKKASKQGLDTSHKTLSYSSSIFAEAKDLFEETHSLFKSPQASDSLLARNNLQKAVKLLIEALALGEIDATEYLASICYNYHDYGIEKNEELTRLFIAIGKLLGSHVKMPMINSENYITIDIVDKLTMHPSFPPTYKLAKKYAAVITKNQQKYKSKQELTTNEVLEAINRFEKAESSQKIKNFKRQILEIKAADTAGNELDDNPLSTDPAILNRLLPAEESQEDVAPIGVEGSSCCGSCAIM